MLPTSQTLIGAAYGLGLLACLAWASGHNLRAAALSAAAALTALLAEYQEQRGR